MKMSPKKGQTHISETIAVLFIFFVLVFFGILFYYKYSQAAIKQEKEELLGRRAVETMLQALFLPELICSNGGDEPQDNCVDLLKARHANKTFQLHEQVYFDLFSYARFSLIQLYPTPAEGQEEIIIYDKVKPDWKRKETTYSVIALRDELQGNNYYGFGYIQVEVYS